MLGFRTVFILAAISLAAMSDASADGCHAVADDKPVVLGPETISNTGDEVFRGVFSPNNTEFYFFRSLGPNESYGIFKSTRSSSGNWKEAERVIIGADHSDLYPAISPDGNELIFVSYRPVSGDASDNSSANIWTSRLTNGIWEKPTLLDTLSNPLNYDNRPLFRSNGDIGFSSTSPDWRTTIEYIATRNGNRFEPPRIEEAREQFRVWAANEPSHFVWTSDLSPDGKTAIIEVSDMLANGRPGPADLWISRKKRHEWTVPARLNDAINTDATENFPTFSADGDILVFVRDFKSFHTVNLTCK